MSKNAVGVAKKEGKSHKKNGHHHAGHHYEWEFARPLENLTRTEKLKRAIYNPREGTYLGRTPIMWLKLLVFYIIFYICTAILFMICITGLLLSLNEKHPRYVLEDSIIGTNPGLGFRPMPENYEDGNSLIWIIPSNSTNVDKWVNLTAQFLEEYKMPSLKKGARQMCDYDSPPSNGKVCDVDIDSSEWGACSAANKYGFATSSPCVFIKLNRIFDWVPDYYNSTNELPAQMPEDLVAYIRKIKNKKQMNTAWLSCHGETPSDNENLGPMEMYPTRGFPGYYYPYTNQEGYLSPLVAVHFRRPAMNTLISIECRIWAKNTHYRKSMFNKEGAAHFELLLD